MSVLRVLWMSTHGSFAPPIPPIQMLRSDVGPQESAATADGYYYPDGAYYYVEAADNQE